MIRIGLSVTRRHQGGFLLRETCRGYASQSQRQREPANVPPKAKNTSQSVSDKKPAPSRTPSKAPANATTTSPLAKRPVEASAEKKGRIETDINKLLDDIDALTESARRYPFLDPWGQKIETLDVQIPYVINLSPFHKQEWSVTWKHLNANLINSLKNATSMYRLAAANSFPGIDLRPSFFAKLFKWPARIFRCASVKPDEWIAPIRRIALETYISVNKAVSGKDEKTIKRLTTSSYQETLMRLVQQNARHKQITTWQLHGEESPVRVVSIRALDGYLAKDDPKIGTRLFVQALVRFDTKQSVQRFTMQGQRMNEKSGPKRVIEYLILEKRMWYNSPWIVKEQLFEPPSK